MSRSIDRRSRLAAAFLAAGLLAGASLAVAEPLPRGERSTSAEEQLPALDYRVIKPREARSRGRVSSDPTLNEQLGALDLRKAEKTLADPDAALRKLPIARSYWVPSWLGTTGGLDIPWAYTVPKGQLVAALTAKNRSADASYWPRVYQDIEGFDRGVVVNYGLFDGVEVTAGLDRWDRTLQYASQNDTVTGAALPGAIFNGERGIPSLGAKGVYTTDDFHVAVGFLTTFFDNIDRNIIEMRDYDRLNTVYAVGSTRSGENLAGHVSVKYVSYDWAGGIFPSGATVPVGTGNGLIEDPAGGSRRGFGPSDPDDGAPVFLLPDGTLTQSTTDPNAVIVGKGTQDWLNLALGIDFEVSKHFRILLEANGESGIDFDGVGKWFGNAGARYERRNWAATFGMRHLFTDGYREPVLSVAYRF